MTGTTDVLDLVQRWAAAEQDNDAQELDALLADDFVGVGPVGFVLPRKMWLGRFDKGLHNSAFAIEDPQVRDYGSAAVVVGVLAQETRVRDQDNSGRFRVTLVGVRPAGTWRLAHIQIGPLQAPAGAPSS